MKRQRLFLDFLGIKDKTDKRWSRDGLYHTFQLNNHNNNQRKKENQKEIGRIRIILLDTRSFRESHIIPSVGSYPKMPFGAILATCTRWLSAVIGIGRTYHGDVLGDGMFFDCYAYLYQK